MPDDVGVVLTGICPHCKKWLVVRHRRNDNQPFVSCSGYPDCRFAANYDEQLQKIHSHISQLQQTIGELRRQLRSQQPRSHEPASRGRDDPLFKQLLFTCHPDKWGNNPIAEELTKLIVSLREKARA